MLYLPFTKIVDSGETNIAPGASVTAEGQALVRAVGAPSAGVQPSMAADANEIFVGFSLVGTSAAPFPVAYANKVEEFIVPASGIVSLALAPVAGQTFTFNATTGAAQTGHTVTGKNISGLTVGTTVRVTYKHALTVIQARALQGDTQPGGNVGDYVGQVGIAKRGVIYTSEFDASVNWSTATAIKLAANGQVTNQAGAGATLVGAYVVSVPTQEVPFLGLEFSAA